MGSPVLVGLGGAGICSDWAEEQPQVCPAENAEDFVYTVEYENQAFNPGGGHPIGGTGSGVTYWPARDTLLLVDNDNECLHEWDATTKAYIRRIVLAGFDDPEEIHWIEGNTFAISNEFNAAGIDEIAVLELPDGDVDTSVDIADAIRRIQPTNIVSDTNKGFEAFALVDGYFYFTTEETAITPAEWNLWRVANEGTGLMAVAAEGLFDLTPLVGGATDISGMAADEDGLLWLISASANTISQITPDGQLLRTVAINDFETGDPFAQAEGIEFFRDADGNLRLVITGEDPAGVDLMILVPPGIPGPTGETGSTGASGRDGLNAYTTTAETFIVPPVDGTAVITVASSEMFYVGQPVFLEGAGYFRISQIQNTGQMRLYNYGAAPNALPNSAIVAVKKLIGAGVPGPDGETPPGISTAVLAFRAASGTGGGLVEWPVVPVPAYKALYEGPLVAIYDPDLIAEIVTDVCLDNTEPFADPHTPLAFILQPGKYAITARFPAFGVEEYQGRIKVGLIDNESPRNLTIGDPFKSTNGYTDTSTTLQGAVSRTIQVSRGVPVCVWFALTAKKQPTGGNANNALGRPCSFGDDEQFLTVKIRRLERA